MFMKLKIPNKTLIIKSGLLILFFFSTLATAHPLDRKLLRHAGQSSYPFSRFIAMGMKHIGVTPDQWIDSSSVHLPAGIDHILFVVALLLTGGGLLNLLKTVTGFTVGHTISLALASYGFVQFSGRYIEAAIALTIALVALQSILYESAKHRWKMSVGIGLIHGLGFTFALASLHLNSEGLIKSILGFNLGVEIGQGIIIAAVFPLLYLLMKWIPRHRLIFKLASAIIFCVSSYWFVQRGFLNYS